MAFAAALTGRSGKAPVIEAALAHTTGRPRPVPVRALLTAEHCGEPEGTCVVADWAIGLFARPAGPR